jgi:hypothetical protein
MKYNSEYSREYRVKHREQLNAYSKKYYATHREEILAYMKRWGHERRAAALERRRYLLSHPEEIEKIRQRIMDENR